jgi:uncharacterized protein YcbK (DUF882 family)
MTTENDRLDSVQFLDRRDFLRIGGAVAALGALMDPVEAMAAAQRGALKQPTRKVALLNVHTGERLNLEYWAKGRYVKDAMRAAARLLRDHRSGSVHAIDPHLLDVIHALQARTGSRGPFHVVSGYRSPETNESLREADYGGVARHSYHMQGKAVDLFLPGGSLGRLHRAALSLRAGGVGYYPESNFIHVDTGPVRRW